MATACLYVQLTGSLEVTTLGRLQVACPASSGTRLRMVGGNALIERENGAPLDAIGYLRSPHHDRAGNFVAGASRVPHLRQHLARS